MKSSLSCTSSYYTDSAVLDDVVFERKELLDTSFSSPESLENDIYQDSDSYSSDDYDDYDDDHSCDSTVVNGSSPLKPPPTATKDEQNKFYWEYCYGKDENNKMMNDKNDELLMSVNRLPPTKSCLSTKKKCWSTVKAKQSSSITTKTKLTPTLCDRFDFHENPQKKSNSGNNHQDILVDHSLMDEESPEPKISNEVINRDNLMTPLPSTNHANANCHSVRSVTFGSPSAAEFDFQRPTVEFTPLPTSLARERFPIDPVQNESDEESEEEHRETARNAATLAAWDEDFDSLIDADMDEDDDFSSPRFIRNSSIQGRKSLGRDNRRSSSFFSRNGRSLLSDDSLESNNVNDSYSTTPTTPSNNTTSNTTTTNTNTTTNSTKERRSLFGNSMSCLSPSVSDSTFFSKETPNSERTLSSALLRTVHCSGGASLSNANMTIDDICAQKIEPNQLDSVLQSADDSMVRCQHYKYIYYVLI